MADDVRFVFKVALLSRFITLITQVVLNAIVEDYDSSTSMFWSKGILDDTIFKIFSGMAKWDSVYFLQIAENGYLYEQYMAFFPLYPVVIKSTASVLFWLFQVCLEYRSVLLLSSWVTSLASFTFAAVLLYKLTAMVFKNREMAIVSSILFCINPATVFMSGAYTESLFACLQFAALYSLESGEFASYLLASALFGLGSATRSNGIISAGFITHAIVKELTTTIILKKKQLNGNYKLKSLLLYLLILAVRTFVQILFYNGLVILPFILFQYYGYFTYCALGQRTAAQSPWCGKVLPLPYSYIQDHYWDVGFLRYFELKQTPNFLLAAPVVILSLCSLFSYCVNDQNIPTVKTLGLMSHDTWQKGKTGQSQACEADHDVYNQHKMFVYLIHLLFLTSFGFTSMHVQVVTRFICSSSPAVYWYSAQLILKEMTTRSKGSPSASTLIVGFFILYFFLGIALHCNFYPWT